MLFAMFSTFNCCAFMPLAALKSARIIWMFLLIASNLAVSKFRHLFDGFPAHVVRNRDGFLHHLELPHHAYQAHGSVGRADVRGLNFSLVDLGAAWGHSRGSLGILIVIATLFQQRTRLLEVHQLHVADRLAALLHCSVR